MVAKSGAFNLVGYLRSYIILLLNSVQRDTQHHVV